MERDKDSALLVSQKVTAERSQLVVRSLHSLGYGIALEPESYCRHFCDGEAAAEQPVSPAVHCLGPLGEPLGNVVAKRLRVGGRELANLPEVSPPRVVIVGNRSLRFVSGSQRADDILVISEAPFAFGCRTILVEHFWEDIVPSVPLVVALRTGLVVPLHHVQVLVVILEIDSRVLDKEAPISVESVRDFDAVRMILVSVSEKRFKVDDRNGLGEEPIQPTRKHTLLGITNLLFLKTRKSI